LGLKAWGVFDCFKIAKKKEGELARVKPKDRGEKKTRGWEVLLSI